MSTYENIKLDPQGVVYDTNPHDVDEEYTDVRNIRFKNKAAEKFGGDEEQATTTAQATHLLYNGNREDPLWLYMGDGVARVTNFTTDKDIEGTALTSGTDWNTCLFNQFPVVNNTVDEPRYWDNDFITPGTLADLPAWPTNHLCQSIRPFRSFMIAMNITVTGTGIEGNRVLWSDSSDAGALPASWDIADPTTLAGDAYLTDDRGEIVDGYPLRDLFVIYKTHSTYVMRLIGGQAVMRIDKVQVHSGILTKNCVTEFKGRHFVVTDGDIMLFDGQNIESIAEKRVRSKIFDNIDPDNLSVSHVARYDRQNEIWFCYPTTGQTNVNMAAVWNWRDNSWSFRELTDTYHVASGLANLAAVPTWGTVSGTWTSITGSWSPSSQTASGGSLATANTLAIHAIDDTYDFDGSAMSSLLEKATMDLGNPDYVKVVKSVTPRITADTGTKVYIRIGTQDNPYDTIEWGAEVLYTVGTDREAHFTQKGRFISIRMRTQDTNTNWKCHGFYIKAAVSGRH